MERIDILGVPVDICAPENLENEILKILEKPGVKQIIFLSIWDLLRARKTRNDFSVCVKNADLILPISKSILKGAAFLKKSIPIRYNPFNATIEIFSVLDKYYKSLYFLGGRNKTLKIAEQNVHETFPNLQIVGRCVGYFGTQMEDSVAEAIFKAQPALVLISEGIREKECWAYRRKEQFSASTFLYYKDSLGIFSNQIKHISERTFKKGREIWNEIAHNPAKIFLLFPYLKYKILLFHYKFFKKEKIPKNP